MLGLLPKIIWKNKIRTRKKRLGENLYLESSLASIDDYLLAGNNIALEYFKKNKNPFRKLWEYGNLQPHCGSHSTYTYAAFLSLTEKHDRTDLQKDVRLVGGIYVSEKASGHHLWLEQNVGNEWKPFETIPDMREIPSFYSPWYTFQITKDKTKASSEKFLGLLALFTYGFTNS